MVVDVGRTVCPTFKQQLQCGNPAPHSSWQPCQPPNISSHINYDAKHSVQFNYKYFCTKMP